MDPAAARNLLDDTPTNWTTRNRVYNGLSILAKYDEDIDIAADHDIIYASDFPSTVREMAREEVVKMGELGWFCELEFDCWTHYVN